MMPAPTIGFVSRARALLALLALSAALPGCTAREAARVPRRYLVITHSALDRVSFFDLDRRAVVGVLPTQKLPHDMLLGEDGRTLYVVNSGAQCISTYDLGSEELWREARAFMVRDTARASVAPDPAHAPHGLGASAMSMPSAGHARDSVAGGAMVARPESIGARPRSAVQALPAGIEHHHLTEPTFPERARAVHERVGATSHQSCTDCHARSVGAKPFAPVFTDGGRTIRLVHLASRNITELDAATLEVKRQIPLPIPPAYAPVEAWVKPGTDTAFVTCRDSIGRSLPGIIVVVDLSSGARVKTLAPGIYPWHLVPNENASRLYVNNFQSSRITVVDVAREEVVDSLIVENGPSMMLPTDGGRTLLVSCFYTHRVLVVDLATRTVSRRIPVGSNPTTLLPADDREKVWVLCGGESELQLVNLRSGQVVERYPLLFGAYAMQLVPRNGRRS